MGLQYGDDDDDLFDSTDEDEEEAETELSAEPPVITPRLRPAPQSGLRRIRMRPMKPTMADKHPNVVTILLTRNDGRQVMFVRK